jgi:hypothetical protein
MMSQLLTGSPVGDEIAPGYDGPIEGHDAEKQGGKDYPYRACNRNEKNGEVAFLLWHEDTFLFSVLAIISAVLNRITATAIAASRQEAQGCGAEQVSSLR